jgi:hypothetical protein
MYARFQTTRSAPPADLAGKVADLLDVISGHPGFAGAWLLPPIAADAGGLLTLWAEREDAERAAERTAAVHGPRPIELASDTIHRVETDDAGGAADQEPTVAQIVHFDAPRTDEWAAAMTRADRDRIGPAVRGLAGTVRTLVLAGDDNARLVVTLATSVEAFEEAHRRIRATELLDGEDPALLTGPDRIDLHRVAAHRTMAASGI